MSLQSATAEAGDAVDQGLTPSGHTTTHMAPAQGRTSDAEVLPQDDCVAAFRMAYSAAGAQVSDSAVPGPFAGGSNASKDAVASVLERGLEQDVAVLASWLPLKPAVGVKTVQRRHILDICAVFTTAMLKLHVHTPAAMQRLGDLWTCALVSAAGSSARTELKDLRGLTVELPVVDEHVEPVCCARVALIFVSVVLPAMAAVLRAEAARWTLPQVRGVLESVQRAVEASCTLAVSRLPAIQQAVRAVLDRPMDITDLRALNAGALRKHAATVGGDSRSPASAMPAAGSLAVSSSGSFEHAVAMSVDALPSETPVEPSGSAPSANRSPDADVHTSAGVGSAALPPLRTFLLSSVVGALETLAESLMCHVVPGTVRHSL